MCLMPKWSPQEALELISRHHVTMATGATPFIAMPLLEGEPLDQYLRALDEQTGRELWKADLSAAAFATPMTYMSKSGRQLVVVPVAQTA